MQGFCGFALLETVTCTVFSLFVAKYGYKILHSVLFFFFFKYNLKKKKQAHVATRRGFYFESDNLAICSEACVRQLSGCAVKDTGLFTNSRSQHVQNAEVMSQHFLTSLLRNSLPE